MEVKGPPFRGLQIHRDLKFRFSLLYPEGWASAEAPEQLGGTLLYPDPDDEGTMVLVQGKQLRVNVQPEDLGELRAGFEDGLRQLPEAVVEHLEAEAIRDLVTMEARHTFVEGELTRKRWSRLLYQGRTQVTVLAQASSPERFEYCLAMFTTVMRSVQFADWWAEVTGHQWRTTLEGGEV